MKLCVLLAVLAGCSVDSVAMPFGVERDGGAVGTGGAAGRSGSGGSGTGGVGTGGVVGTGGSGTGGVSGMGGVSAGTGGTLNTCGPDGARCGPLEMCDPPNELSGFGGVYPTIAVRHRCLAGACTTTMIDCSAQPCTTCTDGAPSGCFTEDDAGTEVGIATCRCVHHPRGGFCPMMSQP